MLLGAVPGALSRHAATTTYFAMARGTDGLAPLRMTKWFDTNYHYIVPEIGPDTVFALDAAKPLAEVRQARELGFETRPVLVGPVTFLLLSQAATGGPDGSAAGPPGRRARRATRSCWARWPPRASAGCSSTSPRWWPTAPRTSWPPCGRLRAARRAWRRGPPLFVASYFGDLGDALPVLAATPVEAIGVDLVHGAPDAAAAAPGRARRSSRAWCRAATCGAPTPDAARWPRCAPWLQHAGQVVVSTSCSLLHVPYDLRDEPDLDPALTARGWRSPSRRWPRSSSWPRAGFDGVRCRPSRRPRRPRAARREPVRRGAARTRGGPYAVRAAAQAAHLRLPLLPITTIGSFPQTGELRAARAALAAGQLAAGGYEHLVRGRDRAGRRAAGAARAGRARARRAGAQRHGAVLRRAPRRLRRHPARLGPVLRLPLHPAADPARRRRPGPRRSPCAGPGTPSR